MGGGIFALGSRWRGVNSNCSPSVSPPTDMFSSTPLAAVIILLAVGYLLVVYSLITLAKRTGKGDETTII